MYKHIITIFLVSLLTIQAFIPINNAAAVDGLSINATVKGEHTLEIEDNGSVTSDVIFNLFPEGEATSNERKPMDVVIVFDKSGSMKDVVRGGSSKLELAQEAVDQAVNIFFENSKKGFDDRFGLVTFDSVVQYTINNLHSNPNIVYNRVKNESAEGGTNYSDPLKEAKDLLLNAKDNGKYSGPRDQYIIFMTDGKPTNSTSQQNISGNYKELIKYQDYQKQYSYNSYRDKVLAGQFAFFENELYIVSDNQKDISGNYTLHFDSNSDGNNIAFTHDRKVYLYSKSNPTVPQKIVEHTREQALEIAKNNITLLSIGFGEEHQLDMNLLAELSSLSNGKAERASGENIVDVFKDISDSISAEYPSLSNGFIRFVLPSGVTVQQNDKVRIIKEEVDGKNEDVVYMNLSDIKFNPTPPQAGDQSLQYNLPLIFTSPGDYSFSFDVLYNSGKNAKRGLKYDVNVVIPLKKIEFRQKTKTIKIGERIKVEDYLSFTPLNATNKTIKEVLNIGDTSPISIEKIGNEWYVKGETIGFTEIKAVADYKYPTISDEMTIVIKKEDGTTGGTNPEGGTESGEDSDSYGKW
ncbi:VWA domain-containing protein [Metabacillus litoralis]|uniref:VWA domain-containing protein n=1 Tax=Metabacillus litoralis TaxID=152268 RepID=A0A5C6VXT1_9BACI|nr:vWA domain-containing protein [Metabacillus litoralis]TXC90112.1 VWA domain-containing protein [Metabacillus litoralis]